MRHGATREELMELTCVQRLRLEPDQLCTSLDQLPRLHDFSLPIPYASSNSTRRGQNQFGTRLVGVRTSVVVRESVTQKAIDIATRLASAPPEVPSA